MGIVIKRTSDFTQNPGEYVTVDAPSIPYEKLNELNVPNPYVICYDGNKYSLQKHNNPDNPMLIDALDTWCSRISNLIYSGALNAYLGGNKTRKNYTVAKNKTKRNRRI
jgi:hypothetical protein